MSSSLIAIDAGTTGVTCILFDAELHPIARAYREFPQHYPEPGRVEHHAGEILDAVDATLGEVLALPEATAVGAIGITNQRETILALDIDEGRVVGPGIVWQDRRTAARCRELTDAGHAEEVARRSGLVLDPYFSGSKIEWMLAHSDDLLLAAQAGRIRFCTVDALLIHHLTGGALCATDPTNASRTMLFGIDERGWDPVLCELFCVHPAWMPEVRSSAGDFGTTAARVCGREIPIRGVAGDQQAALFGQGCLEEGSFKNTYGTGCFLLLNTGERRVDSAHGLLTTLAVDRRGAPCYALEGSVFAGGLIIQWMRDELGFVKEAAESERIARSVEDTAGVCVVPAFAGLGAPYWDPDARAAILGITRGTSPAHIVRAGLEAIAYQSAEIVEVLRSDTGLAVDALLVDGGASANDFLMQTQADLAGLEVVRSRDVETTARGAAALAGMAIGMWEDPSRTAALRESRTTFRPTLDAAERERRMAAWRAQVDRVRTRA